MAEHNRYKIDGRSSGSLYFKLLMQKAIVDTRATASHLRENLTNLDSYIGTVNSNIQLFNQYVKVNKDGLRARGESTDDIMINLFKGYLHASDSAFVSYIMMKKDQYDEGADMDDERLMQLALNKYKNLLADGKWQAHTPEQEQMLALAAQLEKLKDENLRVSKTLQANKPAKSKENQHQQHNKTQSKKKKPNKNKKRQQEDMAWKKKPPRDGDPLAKQVASKTWHWCPDHLAWVAHEPSEYRLAQERNNSNPLTQRGSIKLCRPFSTTLLKSEAFHMSGVGYLLSWGI